MKSSNNYYKGIFPYQAENSHQINFFQTAPNKLLTKTVISCNNPGHPKVNRTTLEYL